MQGFKSDGTNFPGWPRNTVNALKHHHQQLKIWIMMEYGILAAKNKKTSDPEDSIIYVWKSNGEAYPGWPKNILRYYDKLNGDAIQKHFNCRFK